MQVKRLRKRRQHFLRHGLWGFAQANPLQQHHEFIATEPCHRVAAAYAVHQAFGNALKQQVAHRVPQGVVHFLEAVQVNEEQGKLRLLTVGTGHGDLEPVIKQRAVGQAGELVVLCHAVQALMQLNAFDHHRNLRSDELKQCLGRLDRALSCGQSPQRQHAKGAVA